jgi:hypothetical protein
MPINLITMEFLVGTLQKVLEFENSCFEVYSVRESRPYGAVFYNRDNSLSWDSNHARIGKYADADGTVEDIKLFYHGIGIAPRIFLLSDKKNKMDEFLQKSGSWKFLQEDRIYLVQKRARQIPVESTVEFKQLFSVSKAVEDILLSDKTLGEWSYKTLREAVKKPDFFLFAGSMQGKTVCVGSLHIGEGIGKVDHVHTGTAHRNKGCCSQLINYITEFNRANFNALLYLYSDNPGAVRIYARGGYEPVKKVTLRNYWFEG